MFSGRVASQITAFPYLEDFEQFSTCNPQCVVPCPLVNFWENPRDDDFDWIVFEGATPSPNTGPKTDALPGTSQGNYLYLESDFGCTHGQEAHLLSPEFDFSQLSHPVLSFAYHSFGLGEGEIHLDLWSQGSWQYDIIEPIRGSFPHWQRARVPLFQAGGLKEIRLRWRGITGPVETCDLALDAVEITTAASHDLSPLGIVPESQVCLRGNDSIGVWVQNTGTQTIHSIETRTSWNGQPWSAIQFFSKRIEPGETEEIVLPTPALAQGLQQVSIVARAAQGLDQISLNDTFSTALPVRTVINEIPYLATYEVGPMAWESEGTRNPWEHGAPRGSLLNRTPDGNFCWATDLRGNYANNSFAFLYSPCFDLRQAYSDPVLSFDYMHDLEFGLDFFWLEYSLDGGSWQRLGNQQSGLAGWYNHPRQGWTGTSHGWRTAAHRLNGMQGHLVQVRFILLTDGSRRQEGVLMDRFMLRYEHDLIITGISPGDVCDLSLGTQEYIEATIRNQGYFPASGFDLRYRETGNAFHPYETFIATIPSGDEGTFVFSQPSDLSAPGAHWLEVEVQYPQDVVPANNQQTARAGNYNAPVIDLGADTLICPGKRLVLETGISGGTYQWNTGHINQNLYVFQGGTYEVEVTDSVGCKGFGSIRVDMPPPVDVRVSTRQPIACYGERGSLEASASGGASPLRYQWSTGDTTLHTRLLHSGLYTFEVTDREGCLYTVSQTLSQPDSLEVIIADIRPVSCPRDSNGRVEVEVRGGTPPYDFAWSDGSSSPHLEGARPGDYQVSVLDQNLCAAQSTQVPVPVSPDTTPRANFEYEVSGGTVSFNSEESENASGFLWNFGDGSNISGTTRPRYTYLQNGLYPVMLIAKNACGADTLIQYIRIIAVGVPDPADLPRISLYPNPVSHGQFFLENAGKHWQGARVALFDLQGKRLQAWDLDQVPAGFKQAFYTDNIPAGTYLIRFRAEGRSRTWKVAFRPH